MERLCAPVPLTDGNLKLTRTVSVSDIPEKKTIVLQQQSYDNQRNNGLFRKLSCEQKIDPVTNLRQMEVSQTLCTFKKNLTSNTLSLGPSITTTNSLVYQPLAPTISSQSNFTSLSQPTNDATTNERANSSLGSIGKSFSCSDVHNNSLESCIKRLNLNPRKKDPLFLPPPPATPPLKDPSPPPDLPQPSSSFSETLDKTLPSPPPTDPINSKTNFSFLADYQQPRLTNFSQIMLCTFKCASLIALLSVCVAFLSVVVKQKDLVNLCSPVMNFSSTINELNKRVYGHNEALREFTEFLQTRTTGFQVAAIVGGTGVGKSHTANIMKQILEDTYTSIEFVPPLTGKDMVAYKALAACKCNLVVVDNVHGENVEETAKFCANLRNRARNYCILALVLVNTQEVNRNLDKFIDMKSSLEQVSREFLKEDVGVKLISYGPLEMEILDHCILEAADLSNVTLTMNDIEEIRRDLVTLQSGCKGAYAKVQVLKKDDRV